MDLQLSDKTAFISGSTAGIGYAIAAGLAKEGATVIINSRKQERVDEAIAQLQSEEISGKVSGIAADLSTAAGAAKVIEQFPSIDILINNVGIYEPKPFEEITDDEWLNFYQVNVMSGVRLSRAYLSGMKQRNWGRIIFISSESGVHIPGPMVHYGMTKAAQIAIARGLAETTAGTAVTVNSVLAGPTYSEGVSEFVEQMADSQGKDTEAVEAEFFKETRPTSLIQRFAAPEEVASLVVYVASPLSAATNGAPLRVEGGCIRAAF
ncbi:MAG: SDR family NAD(P)-dependent oxidoreductase [Leptolyngbyaceae cyanobacterium SM1_1_3]|nr:SDR family NAD(P)-dependent oxidoreductase [Leptolyngbyaceae cyanobacterium SM1_1_3]